LANNSFRFLTDYISAQRFVKLLKAEKPEIILSTHFLLSSIITVFKRKVPSSKLRLLTIITDYNLHPYWIGEGVDLYIVSCGYVRDELQKRAISEDKIKVYGIPAHQKFYLALDRNNTARKLGVEPSKFTILIITGTIGIGPIEEIVKALADIAQLLVVCGRNQGLFMRLDKLSHPHVTPYPLIDYVDELMSVSDIVLTKAGGLTISESLAKRLPMIFFSSIPGLETANARVISAYGASFITRTIPEIKEKALSLMNDLTLSRLARNLNALRKVDALSKIASEIPSPASTTS
jgi:processive 1,2-diacylglycerol beta-glucosyltransferase